jgi:hypothetical protein
MGLRIQRLQQASREIPHIVKDIYSKIIENINNEWKG